MLRELVLVLTRGTSPTFESEVYFRVGVQDGLALLAGHGRVLNQRHVFNLFHWRVEAADRNHDTRGAYFVAGPEVPAEADSILVFSLIKEIGRAHV